MKTKIVDYFNEKIGHALISYIESTNLIEIRLRINKPLTLISKDKIVNVKECIVSKQDISDTFNLITGYSAYAFENQIKNGYISVPGGHRIGLGGQVIFEQGQVVTIKNIGFLNFRISHEIKGCGMSVYNKIKNNIGSILIISPPGLGKTTLLRDLIRILSSDYNISVVDERNEISGSYLGEPTNDLGINTDVIYDSPKYIGIIHCIRSLNPSIVAVDEIGTQEDINAIKTALNSGVMVFATIHSDSIEKTINKIGQEVFSEFQNVILIKGIGDYVWC